MLLFERSPRRSSGTKPLGRPARPERLGSVPHAPRPVHEARHPVHVTIKRVPAAPSFRVERLFIAIKRQIGIAVARGARVLHFSLQPDHIHLIVEAADRERLARDMQLLFSRIAFEVNRVARRSGKLFRDRHHRHELATPTEVRRTLVYVLFNNRKHCAETSRRWERAALDPCASAVWFDDWAPAARPPPELLAEARARAGPCPLAAADTWLATVGWKRARGGAIRFDEMPHVTRG
jgi:REP-associated tyrosine transposase